LIKKNLTSLKPNDVHIRQRPHILLVNLNGEDETPTHALAVDIPDVVQVQTIELILNVNLPSIQDPT
jgi:hypothetical protein